MLKRNILQDRDYLYKVEFSMEARIRMFGLVVRSGHNLMNLKFEPPFKVYDSGRI